jgi:hypothetical protein
MVMDTDEGDELTEGQSDERPQASMPPARSSVGDIEPFDPADLPVASIPTAAPSRPVRALAFASIVIAGLCGGLIGYAFTDLQCTDGCSTLAGGGALLGAIIFAAGVAIVAVLVLRAMDEWQSSDEVRPRPQNTGEPGR